ncbi:NADH-quinone oxidoreductase subunit M [Candidatus Paracaedibacter symbiosus]|uniref:NADH-quinone oxidoreductase subunit M n=1 Tax=Candidatus Paracaedibacter symbiosus TaxID=244582 RepID=UPI000509B9D4
MADFPLLSIIIFLPLVGALFILLIRGEEGRIDRNSRIVALWTSLLTFVLSVVLVVNYDSANPSYQFVENSMWIEDLKIRYHIGVDGISVFFILLSTFLTPLCILSSWTAINTRVRGYMLAFLFLETLMIGMFCALDLVLFYVFFEGVLIPMFLIIGIWGGARRIYSCFKFFLYTFLGSVLMLLAIIAIYLQVGTTDLDTVALHQFSSTMQYWLWLAFFASFAVKVPMWPVHTWLPDAHVEAPTAGSVILAGVLLKMGGYGFLRFSIPLFPEASMILAPFVMILSVIAIIYTSLVALVQQDMKKLIAYSSVAHMGFVTLGVFALTLQSVAGAVIQMLSHGIVSAALFLCVGVVYDRLHTREIAKYGGLVKVMPLFAVMFMIFTLASVGLPGTSGFIGEFLVIVGSFKVTTTLTTLAASGMILGAAYGLWLYRRIIFGKITNLELKSLLDLNGREIVILTSLAVVVFWMGIYPTYFINIINPSVERLVKKHQEYAVAHKIKLVASAEAIPNE